MDKIYKLLLVIAVLAIAVGCENKCDEEDFIGFKQTQDKFFYDTKIFATKVDNVTKVANIVESAKASINAFGNNLIVTTKREVMPSGDNVNKADTKASKAWDYQLFDIQNSYPSDYEIACGLELCCYSCVGIEDMFFDESGVLKAKIDEANIYHWYVYYNNDWWQWDVSKANIPWGSLITPPAK